MTIKMEGRLDVEPLPNLATIEGAIAEALPSLEPRARVTVSETAPDRMIKADGNWVPWRADVAPYMTEPMDVLTSRRFDSVAFIGPARSSKSEALIMNPIAHAILAQPRKVAVFSPTKGAAKEWSEGDLDPMIQESPELRSRLAKGKGSDNIFTKRFRGGMRLTVDHPAKDKLAQRSLDLVCGTDFDAFPQDIGRNADADGEGEGGPFGLMRKRTESAGSRGMTVVESSPRFPVLDETWTPTTPHEGPPCMGIVSIYNEGSRGRYYWPCQDCGQLFEPRYDRLDVPPEGDIASRAAKAAMVCPHCGSVHEARRKTDLNAAGQWLHEEANGEAVPLMDLVRDVVTASYWATGPMAALAPWSRIVRRYLEAEAEFQRTGSEGSLKSVTNTEHGLPYLPRAKSATSGLSLDALKALLTDHAWQVAPADTAFLTAAVDVQSGYFAVQVEAWLPGLGRVVIDRFEIIAPPDSAPNPEGRKLSPDKVGEDWDALLPIFEKAYQVEGADHSLKILAVVSDARGEPGVTARARDFYRKMRMRYRNRFYLTMGVGGWNKPRSVVRRPETAHRGKEHVQRDVPMIFPGIDHLKDEVATSLLATDSLARRIYLPRYLRHEAVAEYCAERRTDDGWRLRPGIKRNESMDLSVYSLGLVIALEAEAINWDAPPNWAKSGPDNLMAVVPAAPPDPAKPEAPQKPKPAAKWAVKKPRKRW
ncbi:MAG: terminase gpA endonuclease subunit [Pseudomonadota bacterium]